MARRHSSQKLALIKKTMEQTRLYDLGVAIGQKASQWNPEGQEVVIRDIPISTKFGKKIVVVGDIHADSRSIDADNLAKLGDLLCAIDDVWMYAFVGDYINDGQMQMLPALCEMISRLERPVMAVMGNHDHRNGVDEITQGFEKAGAVVLANENIELDGITICGIDSWTSGMDDADQAIENVEGMYIVLGHEPVLATMHEGYLHVAGHTHHGQISVLKNKKGLFWPRGSFPYKAGLYQEGERFIYTTAGIGYSVVHARMMVPPEIVVLEI